MKKNLLFVSIFLSFLFVGYSLAHAALYRTLRQGSTGADVRELQVFLNKDPQTRIATSGAGSPGKETSSFGALTKAAVLKFQAKYASEVLYPAGISFPTGVVGEMTRAKLNSLYPSSTSSSSGGATPTTPSQTIPGPSIASINPSIITANPQTVTISGSGFTGSNSVVIASDSEYPIGMYSSSDGKTISIPFSSSTIEKMKTQLARYKGSGNYQAILSAFVGNLTGETVFTENGTTYLRAILLVKNTNGQSNTATVKIDIKSILQ